MQTMLVTEGNRGEQPPRIRVTPKRVTAMETAANEMQTIQRIS